MKTRKTCIQHIIVILLGFTCFKNTLADTGRFKLAHSQATFRLLYTLGTHLGSATLITGLVQNDPKTIKGKFSIPITHIKTGNPKQDCHLLEALGLNYLNSKYPKEHVCTESHELREPIPYPTVSFDLLNYRTLNESHVEVEGLWNIHGVTQKTKFNFKKIKEPQGLRFKGSTKLYLSDFEIVVKPAKIAFLKIQVSNEVELDLNLLLTPDDGNTPQSHVHLNLK